MNNPIYYLMSVVIGTSIILLFMRLNTFAGDNNFEAQQEELLIRNFMTTQEILEFHLKKIGYRTGNNSIIEADSSRIKFACDDDQDGQLDVLEIKTKSYSSNTSNPNDFGLVFLKNDVEELITPSGVTKFKLEYFDVNGNSTNEKIFIKMIKVTLRMESEIEVNGHYLFFENQFFIKPRNLV